MKTIKPIIAALAAALIIPAFFAVTPAVAKEKDKEVSCPSGINHGAWDKLLKKYVNNKGLVDYTGWKNNKADLAALDNYLKQFAPKADRGAQGNEKAASLVNAYNAITIHTILNSYPVESIHETKDPFSVKSWMVGGEKIALNDIENGTLRPMLKYRAHAVLVCAARSCPPLQRSAYKASSFDKQDDAAYRAWLGREDLNKFMPEQKKAEVSSIFKWFKADFEKSMAPAKIFSTYGPASAKKLVAGGQFETSYLSYNWGLNDQGSHGRSYSKINLIFDRLTH